MNLKVNGKERTVDAPQTVATLLDHLEIGRTGVAVAVNRHVVPRSRHVSHDLAEADEIEIIRAVGGG